MINPLDRTIVEPPNGWEEKSHYICDVSFDSKWATMRMILFSGELRDGEPGPWNMFFHIGKEKLRFQDVHHIKVLAKINFKSGVPRLDMYWEDDDPLFCEWSPE